MEQPVLSYIQTLIWPAVVVFALLLYRNVIREALTSLSEVTITFYGIAIKIPLNPLITALQANIPIEITDQQWDWLKRLNGGRQRFDPTADYLVLIDLRNAGLIRAYPEKILSQTKEVEITPLGKILYEARQKSKT